MNSAQSRPQIARPGLRDELRVLIAQDGPITVERYMSMALGHPRHGYYMTRDPFGAAGDFTTAPEISQMFGELVGLWAAEVWHGLGRPDPVRFVELGPGRGTLMADALRAARALPPFRAAIDVHCVETSPVLRVLQKRTLAEQATPITWHASLDSLPEGATIVVANEFFDALPIRQFVRTGRGWCERLVGLDADHNLVFGLAGERERSLTLAGPEGAVLEVSAAGQGIMRDLALRLARSGGALLAIDYGHATSGFGDTLQALKAHHPVDVLAEPGEADLTAHVDFAVLARIAAGAGLAVHGPVTQGAFLRALGIVHRAAALKARASTDQIRAIDAAVGRLTEAAPGMGDLFKVLAVTRADGPVPPGFASELPV